MSALRFSWEGRLELPLPLEQRVRDSSRGPRQPHPECWPPFRISESGAWPCSVCSGRIQRRPSSFTKKLEFVVAAAPPSRSAGPTHVLAARPPTWPTPHTRQRTRSPLFLYPMCRQFFLTLADDAAIVRPYSPVTVWWLSACQSTKVGRFLPRSAFPHLSPRNRREAATCQE